MSVKSVGLVDLKKQYVLYKEAIDKEMAEVIDSTSFILGEKCGELERRLADYVGVKHAIASGSGTDALVIALLSFGVGPGDVVITSPFTFIATAEVIALLGAIPVFVDIEPSTFNMDKELLKKELAVRENVKAIIPVSLFGQPADLEEIQKIGSERNIPVIEDGCQSFGARYKGKKSCGITDVGLTSFFPAKPLGCFGDGGMIFTNDDILARKMRGVMNHGQEKRYVHTCIGINGRMDTLQAAVLLGKFPGYEREVSLRQEKARFYDSQLEGIVSTPYVKEDRTSVYAQYTIRIGSRDEIGERLKKKGVSIAVHYPIPLHLQEAFSFLGYKKGDFPQSEKAADEVLSIPIHPFIEDCEQQYVIDSLKDAIKDH